MVACGCNGKSCQVMCEWRRKLRSEVQSSLSRTLFIFIYFKEIIVFFRGTVTNVNRSGVHMK